MKNLFYGLFIMIITFLSVFLFSSNAGLTDSIYTNGVFTFQRIIYDFTIGNLPFPFIYLLLPALLFFLFYRIGKYINQRKFKDLAVFLFNFVAIFLACFYWFWGFNYYATNVENRMQLQPKKLILSELKERLEETTLVLVKLRDQISTSVDITSEYSSRFEHEKHIRGILEKELQNLNYSVKGKVRVRKLLSGVLMRLRTSGIYIPYVFEGHFDGSLHPIQWSNTVAHEMSHGYGITDEGECNFLAYLVCQASDNPQVQYSGMMSYWRYLATAVLRADPEYYQNYRAQLDQRIIADLDNINLYLNKYKELMPVMRDKIYDNYLKAHGVDDGIVSYSRLIDLVEASRRVKKKE